MPGATKAPASLQARPIGELTKAVLGRDLSMAELAEFLAMDDLGARNGRLPSTDEIWVGSIGYEQHKDVRAFAERLRKADVECLIDVRELPISRRKGYAKTALSAAMAEFEIEYLHMKSLGNPKPLRDLYKSGRVTEGRRGYARLLAGERVDALREVAPILSEKRSALMCVEHDEAVCHRQVILEALRKELGLDLDICRL